jgi:hypothetical protein
MEAFILAARLRMIGPTVKHVDAELEQPNPELGPALSWSIAPGRPIVNEDRIRQPITAECALQLAAYGDALLVGTGLEAQRIARVIIQRRQRMATSFVRQGKVAFEVHLPQHVRCGLLEAPIRLARPAARRIDASVTAQDRVHRGGGWSLMPLAFEAAHDLACPPGRVCVTHRQHPSLHRRSAAPCNPDGASDRQAPDRRPPTAPTICSQRRG